MSINGRTCVKCGTAHFSTQPCAKSKASAEPVSPPTRLQASPQPPPSPAAAITPAAADAAVSDLLKHYTTAEILDAIDYMRRARKMAAARKRAYMARRKVAEAAAHA